jgi:hypothetical protein
MTDNKELRYKISQETSFKRIEYKIKREEIIYCFQSIIQISRVLFNKHQASLLTEKTIMILYHQCTNDYINMLNNGKSLKKVGNLQISVNKLLIITILSRTPI